MTKKRRSGGWRGGVLVALAIGAAGAAHAQTPPCEAVKPLLVLDRAKTGALRGAQIEVTDEGTVYAAKTDLPGFSGCTMTVAKEANPYRDHAYECKGELASGEAATRYMEDVWACTRDLFSQRGVEEEWVGGRYQFTAIEGQATEMGREEEISFGDTDYYWLWIDRLFPDAAEIAVRVFYYHLDE